jgi:hypothetical protein
MEDDNRSDGAAVPPSVHCRGCDVALAEEEAQAVRWLYWSVGREGQFPLCEPCSRTRFGEAGPAPFRTSAST